MLKIQIHGLSEGEHELDLDVEASKVPFITPEFVGAIDLTGTITKQGVTFIVRAVAKATVQLVCDRTGEEYAELLEAPIHLVYEVQPEMAELQEPDSEPPLYLFNSYEAIDVTEEVRQELIVHLPMRRIAPAYRDKPLEDVLPGLSIEGNVERAKADEGEEIEESIDPRWRALKKIQFNSNDN